MSEIKIECNPSKERVGGEIIFMRQWVCEKVGYNAMFMNR